MPTRSIDHRVHSSVPVEHAGKWVAWNADHSQILAHAESMQELWRIVHEREISNPIFEKIPRTDVRFVGVR